MKYLIFLLFLIPAISAVDCTYLENEDLCNELLEIDKNLVANLIQPITNTPNYNIVDDYNSKIIEPQDNKQDKLYIKDAYYKITRLHPQIHYNNEFLTIANYTIHTDYNYNIELPDTYINEEEQNHKTCKITYNIEEQDTKETIENQTNNIKGTLTISIKIKETIYEWDYNDGDYNCNKEDTSIIEETLTIQDNYPFKLYNQNITTNLSIENQYYNTTKLNIIPNNEYNTIINFNNANYQALNYEYQTIFLNNILTIKAIDNKKEFSNNIIHNNNTLYVENLNNCNITSQTHFKKETRDCNLNTTTLTTQFQTQDFNQSFNLLIKILMLIAFFYAITRIVKKGLGKYFFLLLLLIPTAYAETTEEECGILNLGTCLIDKAFDFIIYLLNSPIEPMLEKIKAFLEVIPDITLFTSIWIMMIYIISLFYGILFMYSGFSLIISGHDVIKREMAKEWLQNTIVMIILIQASFYLYELTLEIGFIMTSTILSLVDPSFFLVQAENFENIGLGFFLYLIYVIILLITLVLLSLRYLVIALGVILTPFAIFFYFIPPLRNLGRLIFKILGTFIFSGVIIAIIILVASQLLTTEIYSTMKILAMVTTFLIVDYILINSFKQALINTNFSNPTQRFVQAKHFLTPNQPIREQQPVRKDKALKEFT